MPGRGRSVRDQNLGGEQQGRHARGVLPRRADDLQRIDDTFFEEVAVIARTP